MGSRKTENAGYLGNPYVKAFLDLIARAEGTYGVGDNGYNILYGFGTFTNYAEHPNIRVTKGGLTSTAAGRYQFLKRTWDGLQNDLGLPDFSPNSQDIGAIELVRQKSGALNAILSGNVESAINKVNKVWASFPGAGYTGQGTRSMSQMLTWYAADLNKYGGGNQYGHSQGNNNTGNNNNTVQNIVNAAGGATKITDPDEAGFGNPMLIGLLVAAALGFVIYNYT